MTDHPIYHLVPAAYYLSQAENRPYYSETFAQEGFIHCTAGVDLLLQIANSFFADLSDDLLALEIDPAQLTAPLKFEPPIPPPGTPAGPTDDLLFPHIYGPLNRQAITGVIRLCRNESGRWQFPPR